MNAVGFSRLARAKRGTWLPRAVVIAACFTGMLALNSRAASADPIRIVTSGMIDQLPQDNETSFQFRGTGFDIGGAEVYWNPVQTCGPCTPGTAMNLSATITPRLFPAGMASIDGHSYDTVYFTGNFMVNAGSITVPNVAPGAPYVWPATGFTFTGSLSGYGDSTLTGTPLFSTRLAGRGTASLGFFNDGTGVSIDAFRYEFTNAAPTPEPATLLLIAPGVLWAARQLRRRRVASV